jgi:hypothetical protein
MLKVRAPDSDQIAIGETRGMVGTDFARCPVRVSRVILRERGRLPVSPASGPHQGPSACRKRVNAALIPATLATLALARTVC